jgi:hypothetical protein
MRRGGLALLTTVLLAMVGWRWGQPLLIVVPSIGGVSCPTPQVCTDDPSRIAEARALYSAALEQVQQRPGTLSSPLRVIFCATTRCAQTFGLGRDAGRTLGTLGIVIAPRG